MKLAPISKERKRWRARDSRAAVMRCGVARRGGRGAYEAKGINLARHKLIRIGKCELFAEGGNASQVSSPLVGSFIFHVPAAIPRLVLSTPINLATRQRRSQRLFWERKSLKRCRLCVIVSPSSTIIARGMHVITTETFTVVAIWGMAS